MSSETIDETIERYIADGFRLEMIFPADSPRVVELSRGDERIRVETPKMTPSDSEWHAGRAGMEYRDLIPDRLGGRVIASHIRIPSGGPIPDYAHYHQVSFQIIYCLSGSARLVYDGQGPPFDFSEGDCVLQPPEIRHRVLECSDGFEVFEVASPAEHPTFAEHSFDLPTDTLDRDRTFCGQRFIHSRAAGSDMRANGCVRRGTGILEASDGAGDVFAVSSDSGGAFAGFRTNFLTVAFVSRGTVRGVSESYRKGDVIVLDDDRSWGELFLEPGAELIAVELRVH